MSTQGTGAAAEEPDVERQPDYRFTLANERTFLAWIRTSLGLLAGAVALSELVPPFRVPGARLTLVLACLALSLVLAVGSYPHWRANQQAMRRERPLPNTALIPVLGGGTVLLVVIACVLILLS